MGEDQNQEGSLQNQAQQKQDQQGQQAGQHASGYDLTKLSPEEQQRFDFAFKKGAEKKEGETVALKELLQKTQKQLESLRQTAELTQQERDALNEQIERIKQVSQTKEQTLAEQLQTLKTESAKQVTDLQKEKDFWHGFAFDSMIRRELLDAASAEKAFNADQVVRLLYEDAFVEEQTNEATKEVTGYLVKLKLPVQEDGRAVTKEFSAAEGVKAYMRENPNLIRSQVTPGAGVQGTHGVRTPQGLLTQADIENPDNYMKEADMRKMIDQVAKGEVV